MELTVEFHFSAAHRLIEAEGRCREMHGHNYRLLVSVDGPVRESDGMVIDFHELDRIVEREVIRRLDGTELNEVLPCPTAERIVEWIDEQLRPSLPQLSQLTLYETPRYSVSLRTRR